MAELIRCAVTALPPQISLFGPAPSHLRLALEKQPRKRRPLVSLYAAYDAWALPMEQTEPLHRLLKCYPKGAKATSRKLCHWGQVRASVCPNIESSKLTPSLTSAWAWCVSPDPQEFLPAFDSETSVKVCGMCAPSNFVETCEVVWIGIPHEPEAFLALAVKAGHPRMLVSSVEDPVLDTLVENLLQPRLSESNAGMALLSEMEAEKHSLEPQEVVSSKGLDPIVSRVLKGKSTVLLEKLLASVEYPDSDLVADMRNGFRLSGWMKNTNLFVPDPRPPKTTLPAQLSTAEARNKAILAKVASHVCDDIATATWNETIQELEKGWIFEDKEPRLSSCLISRRFGVRQGAKVRVIDDGKASGINQTVGLPERFRLHGVEFISALLSKALDDPRSANAIIEGKTLDLTSAYKQYAVAPEDRNVFRLAAFNPSTKEVKVFGACSLPFGTTGSVSGFLRTAAATWHLGVVKVGLAWCNYFDDYPMLSLRSNSSQADQCAKRLLDLLGIAYATSGKKATEFGTVFRALGLLFDLSKFGQGEVTLTHTKERVQELRETLARILREDKLEPAEAESLRGRLHWYCTFLFGRRPCQAVSVLGKRAKGPRGTTHLSPELRESITFLLDKALDAPPLRITRSIRQTFYIFTDGSLEGNFAGLGGILYDSHGEAIAYFSGEVPSSHLAALRDRSSHPIYEIELLAVWVAMSLWESTIRESYTLLYLDNEAAQGALIGCKSSTTCGSAIVSAILEIEVVCQVIQILRTTPAGATVRP